MLSKRSCSESEGFFEELEDKPYARAFITVGVRRIDGRRARILVYNGPDMPLRVFALAHCTHQRLQGPLSSQGKLIQLFSNTCFSDSELHALGINPANREGAKLNIEMHLWPSSMISAMTTGIIAKEILGFDVAWTCGISGDNAMARIKNGYTDVLSEYNLDVYPQDEAQFIQNEQTVDDVGFVGYTVQGGVYVPEFWSVFKRPEIVAYYAAHNDSAIVNQPTIQQIGNFTPPWCSPWNPEGVGNNCMDIKSEDPTFDKGVINQMIVNLKLNMTVSYWGTGLDGVTQGMGGYLFAKLLRGEPMVMKAGYIPEDLFGQVRIQRVAFPPYSQKCYDGNTKSLKGVGSIDCDFPIVQLRKIASPKVMTGNSKDVYHDFGQMYRRFKITQEQMDSLWAKDIPQTGFTGGHLGIEYQIACNHLKNTSAAWRQWASNTYEPPKRETLTLAKELKAFILAVAVLSILACLLILLLLVCYRRHELIKGIRFGLRP
eukprot:jgi/Bigna1/136277/aug1.33_g10985